MVIWFMHSMSIYYSNNKVARYDQTWVFHLDFIISEPHNVTAAPLAYYSY